jgi:hypothetical protein
MNRTAGSFMKAAVIYGVIALSLGVSPVEAGAGIGSVLSLAALVMFLYIVFRTSEAEAS